MNGHLPECPSSSPDPLAADCCCSRLRACEQRVANEIWGAIREGSQYKSGFEGGLDAAREAVATMTFDSLQRDQGPVATQRQVLAAIDALKEKP